jgi:hypothetical protein
MLYNRRPKWIRSTPYRGELAYQTLWIVQLAPLHALPVIIFKNNLQVGPPPNPHASTSSAAVDRAFSDFLGIGGTENWWL